MCIVTQQSSVQKYGNRKDTFCVEGKEWSCVIKLRLFQIERQWLRDLEKGPLAIGNWKREDCSRK